MAITISDIKPSAEGRLLYASFKEAFTWFQGITVRSGYKHMATIANFSLSGQLLAQQGCTVKENDSTFSNKIVEVIPYSFSFPIDRCDLNRTWLAAFAEKYESESEVFIDSIVPYIANEIALETRQIITGDMLGHTLLDSEVVKVAAPAMPTDGASSFAAIQSFVQALPDGFVSQALDIGWLEDDYVVHVSSKVLSMALSYTADKTSGAFMYVGGFRVEADPMLNYDEMFVTHRSNILAIFDDTADVNIVKVIPRDWENKDYLVGGVAVGGSYVDASKIITTNNF